MFTFPDVYQIWLVRLKQPYSDSESSLISAWYMLLVFTIIVLTEVGSSLDLTTHAGTYIARYGFEATCFSFMERHIMSYYYVVPKVSKVNAKLN